MFCSVHVGFRRRSEHSWVWISVGPYLLTAKYIVLLQIVKSIGLIAFKKRKNK